MYQFLVLCFNICSTLLILKFNTPKLLASVSVHVPKREAKCVTLDDDTFKAMLKACEEGKGRNLKKLMFEKVATK